MHNDFNPQQGINNSFPNSNIYTKPTSIRFMGNQNFVEDIKKKSNNNANKDNKEEDLCENEQNLWEEIE